MRILAKAPTRIDLAGGTLDLWPLYLFVPSPTTINIAIDLHATCEITPREDSRVFLETTDQKQTAEWIWSSREKDLGPVLDLHRRYVNFFYERFKSDTSSNRKGFHLRTSARSPAGAGLGGSSALSVAIVGALQKWFTGNLDVNVTGEEMISVTRDIETQVIQVPAGLQDYYGAMFGGLQCLSWLPAKNERSTFQPSLLEDLKHRIVLFYSGQSRNSGINNWSLFKSLIDKDRETIDCFSGIAHATVQLKAALESKNWNRIGESISAEWQYRKRLSAGISTAEIDQAFKIGVDLNFKAGKICGAGGGGCFFLYQSASDPESVQRLKTRLEQISGVRYLESSFDPKGLRLE